MFFYLFLASIYAYQLRFIMKKLVLILFVTLLALGTFAQNILTHYDMGKGRGYLTTTVEMFRPDKTGNTFFFIDFDYGVGDVEGVFHCLISR